MPDTRSLAFAIAILAAALPARASTSLDLTMTVAVGEQQRMALVHVPVLEPGLKYPLAIGFHGGGGNVQGYLANSKLFEKGDRAGFIVAAPEGTPIGLLGPGDHRVWNSGPEYVRATGNADDVAFTRALIDKLESVYPVDPKRVYATGFSNGAQMSYRLALELSDRIAAIAPMSGGRLASGLHPAHPVPVLHFHGAADGVYPLEGGLGPYSIGRAPHVAIADVISEWCAFDGAAAASRTVPHDGWQEQVHDGAAPVTLVLVSDMGHQIAGGSDDHLPHQALKDSPDAIAMALKFFLDHPQP